MPGIVFILGVYTPVRGLGNLVPALIKKKVREAGVLSGCSDLQNQPSGLTCRKLCQTDKDPLIGVGKHVL